MSSSDFAALEPSPEQHSDVEQQMTSCSVSGDGAAVMNGQDNATRGDESEASRSLSLKDSFKAYIHSQEIYELFACCAFLVISFIPYIVDIPGNQRPIPYQYLENAADYVRNLTNNEVNNGITISTTMLFVLGFLLPLVLQLVAALCKGRRGDVHATVCVQLVAQGITLLITEWLKLYVGYLRPVFYEYCVPNDDYTNCTGKDSDVRKSFPSGHASTAFCGLTILTLYLHQRFGIASVRAYQAQPVNVGCDTGSGSPATTVRWNVVYPTKTPLVVFRGLSVLSLAPIALAVYIAASRVVDNKHFPADVVGGAVLGTGISVYVNGLWFVEP